MRCMTVQILGLGRHRGASWALPGSAHVKEVGGVDPSTEFPDQWTAMVEAVEAAGLAEYYGNVGEF